MTKLSWTGFSKKTPQERKEHLKTNALLSQENQDLLDKNQQLTLETANQMAENVIGRFTLPFAICPDVLVDGVTYQEAYLQINEDAENVLEIIEEFAGVLPFDDKASPEVIRREFGLSKNAFKRAVGHLLKEGKIQIKDRRIYLVK